MTTRDPEVRATKCDARQRADKTTMWEIVIVSGEVRCGSTRADRSYTALFDIPAAGVPMTARLTSLHRPRLICDLRVLVVDLQRTHGATLTRTPQTLGYTWAELDKLGQRQVKAPPSRTTGHQWMCGRGNAWVADGERFGVTSERKKRD